jgi:myo-inositol 2-dehydrogenase/D-chiro-inositol 1-dehydrogenase
MSENATRRDFLTTTAAVAGTFAAAGGVFAQSDETIKVGLIGCGGRGSGAANDVLNADKQVKIVAVGDAFEHRAKGTVNGLKKRYQDRVTVTPETTFVGLDAYKKVLAAGVDVVILATPPGFRPYHLEAAIAANKHVFCEKPVAVDGPGIRKVLGLIEESKKKNLAIVAGTQRRHQKAYQEVYKRVKEGAIGDIVATRCSWNNAGIWFNDRQAGQSDVQYQLSNWYHFLWLCGDHIVEQHVHNLDVCNWMTGMHPIKATGMGGRGPGRKQGDPKVVGNIFDHFAVEYEYPNGVKMFSYCRHYPGDNDVSEMLIGSKGTIRSADKSFYTLNGKELYSVDQDRSDTNPYVQEHIDMLNSIRAGKPLNELQNVAESTLTAIMGRMSTYTGRPIKWEEALNSKEVTMPENLTLDGSLTTAPVPVPGRTKFI